MTKTVIWEYPIILDKGETFSFTIENRNGINLLKMSAERLDDYIPSAAEIVK